MSELDVGPPYGCPSLQQSSRAVFLIVVFRLRYKIGLPLVSSTQSRVGETMASHPPTEPHVFCPVTGAWVGPRPTSTALFSIRRRTSPSTTTTLLYILPVFSLGRVILFAIVRSTSQLGSPFGPNNSNNNSSLFTFLQCVERPPRRSHTHPALPLSHSSGGGRASITSIGRREGWNSSFEDTAGPPPLGSDGLHSRCL